jgi:hypothetical protein
MIMPATATILWYCVMSVAQYCEWRPGPIYATFSECMDIRKSDPTIRADCRVYHPPLIPR